MPTGSRDPDVLLDWLIDSMGLVRRRKESSEAGDHNGALHRIMREALLVEPLRGWDSKELGHMTGLSNTGIHHQMVKLRECGLVTANVEGKWNRFVLRGGSISSAVRISSALAKTVLSIRLSELSSVIEASETRMGTDSDGGEIPFCIRISENAPRSEGYTSLQHLAEDLGLGGENPREGDDIASRALSELGSRESPVTVLALSESLSESRGRVSTVVERMRKAGIVERVPMPDRVTQDIFSGLMRQHDARGEEWLMTRGGLGRLDEGVSRKLIEGAKGGSLDTEGVRTILKEVPFDSQRVLLNTLGGRMPIGLRVSGNDHSAVSERVSRMADRTLRRIVTVSDRLNKSLD